MRTKIVAAILCVLAALGLVNVGKSLVDRFFHRGDEVVVRVDTDFEKDFQADFENDFRTDVNVNVDVDADMADFEKVFLGDEVVVDKRFDVKEGGVLDLSIEHADVSIETSDASEAMVRVTLDGTDLKAARDYFESLNFEAYKDGDRLVVKTDPSGRNWNWRSNGDAEVNVSILIPRRFNADLSVAHGDLDVADLVGNLGLRTAHGDVTVGSIDGEKVDVKVAHGDVELGAIKGRSVRFSSAHGDLSTGPVNADELEVKSAHGDIDLDVRGGRSLDILNAHGEISLALGSAVGGSIRNSHGDIDIQAPGNLAANVDFRADRVRVGGRYSFQGSQSTTEMEGALNGGGPSLKASTSFGTIAFN